MYLNKIYKDKSRIDGIGIFAGESIPKGTIVFYYSSYDYYIFKKDFQCLSNKEKERVIECGVEDEKGDWIVAEGDANHSCDANILSIFVDGLYCDIAVKDISAGEEITIDYGLFYSSFPWKMTCRCRSSNCRQIVGSGIAVDFQTQMLWHSRISEAAQRIQCVKQALFSTDDESAKELTIALKSRLDLNIFPYIKFSLISLIPPTEIISPHVTVSRQRSRHNLIQGCKENGKIKECG